MTISFTRILGCQFLEKMAKVAFVPIHIGFIDGVAEQAALRRPAILDDGAVETGQRCNLGGILAVGIDRFAITMNV